MVPADVGITDEPDTIETAEAGRGSIA